MNVDFGLICLFSIQFGLVFLVYHAWKGIKADIAALEVHRRSNEAVTSGIAAIGAKVDAFEKRITEFEATPKAAKSRMEELEVLMGKGDRKLDALDQKLVSISARVSAFARHRKVKDEDEETAPASEDEGSIIPMGQMPPGAIPLSIQPQVAAVPPGFGVVSRSVRHG